MTFSAFSVWQVDPTLPHQQQAVPLNYSPAGTCRGQGFPQEDERVFLGAKSVIQSCYDLTSYPDEEKLPVKIVIKVFGMSNRGEPLQVTFLSISTGDASGAEPGGPGLFCQGVNWLPVPALPVCGMEMQDYAALQAPSCTHSPAPFTASPAHAVGFAGGCSLSLLTAGR